MGEHHQSQQSQFAADVDLLTGAFSHDRPLNDAEKAAAARAVKHTLVSLASIAQSLSRIAAAQERRAHGSAGGGGGGGGASW